MKIRGIARLGVASISLSLLLLPSAGGAHRIYICDSLEWVTISAKSIGVYVTRPASVEVRPGCLPLFTTPVTLVTALKGDPPPEFEWEEYADTPQDAPPAAGTRILVFHDSGLHGVRRIEILPEVPARDLIGFDSRGERVESADEVLSLIDSTLAAQDGKRSFLTDQCMGAGALIDAPPGSDVEEWSPTLFAVPLNRNHERQLLDMVHGDGYVGNFGQAATQWMASRVLCRCFKVDMTRVLVDMLQSDWSRTSHDSVVYYPSRQFAYRTLRDLGYDLKPPEGFRKDIPPPDDSEWDIWINWPVRAAGYLPAAFEP